MELGDDQRATVASEEQALAFAVQSGSPPRKITRREQVLLHGITQEMTAEPNALYARFGIDEFTIDMSVAQGHTRPTLLHLLA